MRPAGTLAAASAALLLAGCAADLRNTPPPPEPPAAAASLEPAPAPAPPRVVVREVKAACVPKSLPRAPHYPDTDRALRDAGGAADRYQLIAAGRMLRERRLALLERIVAGCR
jgi:hypothetical protein